MKEENQKDALLVANLKQVDVLGVRINPVKLDELEEILKVFLNDGDRHYLTTVNSEFVIEALNNERFSQILKYSDLNVADGIGPIWAAKYLKINTEDSMVFNISRSWLASHARRKKEARWRKISALWQAFYTLAAIFFYPKFLKTQIPERITGSKLVDLLVRITENGNRSLYILGGKKGVSAAARIELEKQYPEALIVGNRSGYLGKNETEQNFTDAVNKAKPDILLVAMGSPKQEEWIFDNMDKMPSVKIAVGIGGAIDFMAKKKKRAPYWMRKRGLEWLFRFSLEPKRMPRIKNATFKFIKEVVSYKVRSW